MEDDWRHWRRAFEHNIVRCRGEDGSFGARQKIPSYDRRLQAEEHGATLRTWLALLTQSASIARVAKRRLGVVSAYRLARRCSARFFCPCVSAGIFGFAVRSAWVQVLRFRFIHDWYCLEVCLRSGLRNEEASTWADAVVFSHSGLHRACSFVQCARNRIHFEKKRESDRRKTSTFASTAWNRAGFGVESSKLGGSGVERGCPGNVKSDGRKTSASVPATRNRTGGVERGRRAAMPSG